MTSSAVPPPLPLALCRFAVVDVEATGSAPPAGRLLEVAVAMLEGGTVRLAPELRHRRLDQVAAFFGVANPARHRAFGDALATAYILRALLGRARDRGVETLEQLIDLHDRSRHGRVRSAEWGMRSINPKV